MLLHNNKITRAALSVLLAATLFTGCAFTTSTDSLLAPPKLSEEQAEIYRALTDSVGSDIRLQYPKSGSYRSAFVIENIDEEPSDEAIVFYESTTDGVSDGSLRINILDERDGKWQSVYDHAGVGVGIDRVFFTELGDSGRTSIVIGYNLLSDEKVFHIYVYSGGIIENTYSDNYSSVFAADLTKDSENELVVIHRNSDVTGRQAYMNLVTDNGSLVYESTGVIMDTHTNDFVNIVSGYVSRGVPAVYIDGSAGGQLTTEIFYCVNGILRNPLYISNTGLKDDTRRPSGYLCKDIDLDGIIEIPTLSYFPGYSQYSSQPFMMTDWNILENYTIVKKYSSYYNIENGYCFILPSRWEGVVTMRTDSSANDIVFYKFRGDLLNSTQELMRITAVSKDRRDEKLSNGYTLLYSEDNINYLYKSTAAENEPLSLTDSEIKNNFYVMN